LDRPAVCRAGVDAGAADETELAVIESVTVEIVYRLSKRTG
jgi:hypothetical protein